MLNCKALRMGERIFIYFLSAVAIFGAITLGTKDSMYYASTEHVNVTYYDPDYGYVNATAARPGRWDPKYYVAAYLQLLKTVDNNVKVDFDFYEYRSNEYRRGFVAMHFALCDLILKDYFFGPALRANLPNCPILPGEYHLYNMSITDLPVLGTFPFRKGRIFASFSDAGKRILEGFIDIEIKMRPRIRVTKSNKKNTGNA